MFVEIHLLQNFAPSCLNRDDTNSPKDCEFGGVRRARISSQCIKRSVRNHFRDGSILAADNLSERTKRLIQTVSHLLVSNHGHDAAEARQATTNALAAVEIKADEKGETQYLLFLGRAEIEALAEVVHANWDALKVAIASADSPAAADRQKKKTSKQEKADARGAIPSDVAKAVRAAFGGQKAADLALFGRMLADQPGLNIDAACQVAHALSVNKVSMELDFFTAVDDLKSQQEDSGAGMLGTVEFNSSCFYRYANIDLRQLKKNLGDDEELARKAVEAFLKASIEAIPTGKQNSMAAHNPPSLILITLRGGPLCSLTNAFVKPVRPDSNFSLVGAAVIALDDYWSKLAKVYGNETLRSAALCTTENTPLTALKAYEKASAAEVVAETLAALSFCDTKEAA